MPSDGLSASLEKLSLSIESTTHDFDASQKLGMSLTKADDGRAKVTMVAKDGQAESLGVQVDDVILALDGQAVGYHAVVAGVAAAQGSVRLRFARASPVIGALKAAGKDLQTKAKAIANDYDAKTSSEAVKQRVDAELSPSVRAWISASREVRHGLPGSGGAPGAYGEDDGFLPAQDLSPFLSPDVNARYVAPPVTATTSRYLAAVQSQVLAEYSGFLSSAYARRLVVVRQGDDDDVYALDDVDEAMVFKIRGPDSGAEIMDGAEFHNNLAVFRNYSVVLKYNKNSDTLRLCKGDAWAGRRLPRPDSPWDIMVLGYIGDHVCQYAAARAFADGDLPVPTLLYAVADPTKRRASAGFESRAINPAVPLNDRQGEVLRNLSTNVEGIQGPPGTGKSTVIFHLVNSHLPREEVALATCVQNKAVDAIAEKFAAVLEIPFLVLGNEGRLGELAKQWTVKAQVTRHERVVSAIAAARALRKLSARVAEDAKRADQEAVNYPEKADYARKASDLKGLAAKLAQASDDVVKEIKSTAAATKAQIIAEARVVLCTVATASRSLLIDEELAPVVSRITTAILDEAGTCAEPNLPLLLLLPKVRRIIAIGDQKQLAPFSQLVTGTLPGGKKVCFAYQKTGRCKFGDACRFSHDRSATAAATDEPLGFFQRLERALPDGSVPMLSVQYRMHPTIASYISESFYGGGLRTDRDVALARRGADAAGMYWLTYSGTESSPRDGRNASSKINDAECRLCYDVVTKQPRATKSVMVITFYKAQEAALKAYFEGRGLAEVALDGSRGTRGTLRICSVDQAQGSEADVVVLSCVRANADATVGFLKNPNRLNVAVSRARERLVIVGNERTLRAGGGSNWRRLLDAASVVSTDIDDIAP